MAAPVVRRADPAGRPGGRHRGLAARRRPLPQGGPGAGRRRRPLARPARRHRSPRDSRCSRCSPTSRSASTGRWRRSRALRRRGGRDVRGRPAGDGPGGLMTQLSAGDEFTDVPGRVRMGIGWDKDAGAGVARTGRPEVDLDATALQFAGGPALRPGLLQQPDDPRRLGRAPRRQPDRQRRGRRRGDHWSTWPGCTGRSTRSCSWSAATRATRWSGSPTPTAGWSTTRPTRSWRGSRSRSRVKETGAVLARCGVRRIRLGAARGRRGRGDHGADPGAGQADPVRLFLRQATMPQSCWVGDYRRPRRGGSPARCCAADRWRRCRA